MDGIFYKWPYVDVGEYYLLLALDIIEQFCSNFHIYRWKDYIYLNKLIGMKVLS